MEVPTTRLHPHHTLDPGEGTELAPRLPAQLRLAAHTWKLSPKAIQCQKNFVFQKNQIGLNNNL